MQFNAEIIVDSFLKTLKNSNFLVMKCYKLAFSFKNIGKNVGRILMTIILFLSLIFLIIFCFYDYRKIKRYIKSIFQLYMNNNKSIDNLNHNKKEKKENKDKKGNKDKDKKENKEIKRNDEKHNA